MQRKQMVWRERKQNYGANSKVCYVGEMPVGEVFWNSGRPKGSIGIDYAWKCFLPFLKIEHGANPTEEDCMQAVQTAVDAWFAKVLEA